MQGFSPGVTGCEREKSVTLPECCATSGQTRGDNSWFARLGILSELRSETRGQRRKAVTEIEVEQRKDESYESFEEHSNCMAARRGMDLK
jgi:hypothetical protein